jgi:hypothetical protein
VEETEMRSNRVIVEQTLELAARRMLSRVTLDSNQMILQELQEIDEALAASRQRIACIAARIRGEQCVPVEQEAPRTSTSSTATGARTIGIQRKVA